MPAFAGMTIHMNRRTSPAPTTFSMQRPQSEGCCLFSPTSGRRCRQRSHFGAAEARASSQILPPPSSADSTADAGWLPEIGRAHV